MKLKDLIDENEFFGAPGGSGGTVTYAPGWGTPASPNVSQDPAHFRTFGAAPANKAHSQNAEVSGSNNKRESGSLDKEVDKLYNKPETPSPDEILSGMQYELGHQTHKNKDAARREVIANLQKDPKYYSKLKHMNIDDNEMNVDEVKKIFQGLQEEKDKERWTHPEVKKIMGDLAEEKRQRRAWVYGQKTEKSS
jgi:hypothetical protein